LKYEVALCDVLENDGSLRDVLVTIRDVDEYRKVIEFLRSNDFQFYTELDGNSVSVEDCLSQFNMGPNRLVGVTKIIVCDIQINLWYYDKEELEFDFLPSDVNSEVKWDSIYKFFENLSVILKSNVRICAEGCHERSICEIRA
jgi:hypothetical protein